MILFNTVNVIDEITAEIYFVNREDEIANRKRIGNLLRNASNHI